MQQITVQLSLVASLLFYFATSPVKGQMDTTISKDEYHELVYQLQQSRTQNRLLKDRIVEIEWLVESNNILLKVYQERLHALEVLSDRREKKKKR